jgi:hypothetical protein
VLGSISVCSNKHSAQSTLLKKYLCLVYSLCHSLNLVGCATVSGCIEAFFFLSLYIYIFLKFNKLAINFKVRFRFLICISNTVFDTSWAAHIKGTRAIVNSCDLVSSGFIKIQDDKHENGYTKRETCIIHYVMEIF